MISVGNWKVELNIRVLAPTSIYSNRVAMLWRSKHKCGLFWIGYAGPIWTLFWLILDHIGPFRIYLDHSVFLDQSTLTRLFGPVYLNPSIWIGLFRPVLLELSPLTQYFWPIYLDPFFGHVYLETSIRTRLLGPIYLCPSLWTCLIGPI